MSKITHAALQETLTISAMMQALQTILDRHGDVPIYIDDANAGWLEAIVVRYVEAGEAVGYGGYGEATTVTFSCVTITVKDII